MKHYLKIVVFCAILSQGIGTKTEDNSKLIIIC